jgi:hypothetical protein
VCLCLLPTHIGNPIKIGQYTFSSNSNNDKYSPSLSSSSALILAPAASIIDSRSCKEKNRIRRISKVREEEEERGKCRSRGRDRQIERGRESERERERETERERQADRVCYIS